MSDDVQTPKAAVPEQVGRDVTIDDFAADYDYGAIEHRVVDAPPSEVYSTARHLDLLTIRSRLADLALWVRALPERWKRRVPPRQPTRLTFDDLTVRGDWVLLGERPGSEVVFGAAGRFWTPVIWWEQLTAEEFRNYTKRGLGRVAVALSVRPYGNGRSLITYEARTMLNDPVSRRVFGSYWLTVAPFVKAIMRATLRTVGEQATKARQS